ncbi:hypothetical protein V6N13_121456 [Hibiscus sabdariffa]
MSFIQETKKETLLVDEVGALWYDEDFDFRFLKVVGRSGGLLTVLDKTRFSVEFTLTSTNFISLKGTWSQLDLDILLVNVYAPCQSNEHADLLVNLSALLNGCSSGKVIAGNFNAVRSSGNGLEA